MASVARYCCCGPPTCAAAYEVTVAGIDGNICCVNNAKADPTPFDGVVTAPFLSEPVDGLCVFQYIYGSVTFVSHSDACVTPNGVTRTKTCRVNVAYDLAIGKVTSVTISDNTGGQDVFFHASGSWDLGDTISNSLTCGRVGIQTSWCQVGTVVVDLP